MGYRSQVVIAIDKKLFRENKKLLQELIGDCDSQNQTTDKNVYSNVVFIDF